MTPEIAAAAADVGNTEMPHSHSVVTEA